MFLSVKTITLADIESLMPIETACHSHPWSEKTFTSCVGGRYFGQYIKNKKGDVTGFYIGEHIAGEGTLMDICITPSEQGNGFGKTLLLEFFKQCRQLHLTKIHLEVRAKNISAQMLYINQGFTETGRRTGYYPSAHGFGYEDAIVMIKKL
jgi:ribosomal-protein-alanine N-acetyltransferase